ncbi:MAG TPA: VWA domain-containing protein, partial [Pyrinomonadaceae bacterium]|nr:VWA domain-containing protein [Pyrinomonadaceae bacterium]
AGDVKVVSPLTSDRARLRAAVRAMEPPQGHTRLYDAVNAAMEFYEREAAGSRRRAVILMSDGLDSTMPNVTGVGSTLAFDEVRRSVEEFDGIVYTIWTSTEYEAFSPQDIQPETFDLAHDRMASFAEAGGGVFYDVAKLEDLAGAYERVIEDLGTVYSLSYRPTNRARDGRWRAIRIRLPRHPGAVARGKSRYRAS